MKDKKVAIGIIGLALGVFSLVVSAKPKQETEAVSTEPKQETEEERMLALCGQPCLTEYCM